MKETMLQYIKETPDQCLKNIEQSKKLTKKIVDEFCKKNYQRIQIVASGSSFNGAQTARYFMEKVLKCKVDLTTSFTVLNYESIFDKNTFFIGMGQSGRSTNTNDAMKKIMDQGHQIIGVTGNVDSEMKKHCTAVCYWGVGVEKIGYVTKGYSTSVLFYMLFAIEAGRRIQSISNEEYEKYRFDLHEMVKQMRIMIGESESWYQTNEKELYDRLQRLQITGYGAGLGTAMEGALKIEETMARASTAYEMEEFLHGPFYETDKTRTVIVINTGGTSSERANKLFRALPELTPNVFLITNDMSPSSKAVSVQHQLDETMTALINVIPFQIIAANGKEKWGSPYENQYHTFGDKMNTKSPKIGKEIGL